MEFNATFLISAISFILFTIVMNKIFYRPLERIMADRERFIEETVESAKYSSLKADAIMTDKDEKLKKSANDAKRIINSKITEANGYADELIVAAKKKSQSDIETAKQNLLAASIELDKGLETEIKNLAGAISSKILGFETEIKEV